jgi:hypothetical protein
MTTAVSLGFIGCRHLRGRFLRARLAASNEMTTPMTFPFGFCCFDGAKVRAAGAANTFTGSTT